MKRLWMRLRAIWKIMWAPQWAIVIVYKERTLTLCDLAPENSLDVVQSLVDVVNKIEDIVEAEAQADVNVNQAIQIANKND